MSKCTKTYKGTLKGETIVFPYFGKYCGMYGVYTRDGFVFTMRNEKTGLDELDVMPIDYDQFIEELEVKED